MAAEDASFEAMLAGLLSHDNVGRKRAEDAYNQTIETQPDMVVAKLVRCLDEQSAELLRTIAAVLLRRIVAAASIYWARLQRATKLGVRAGLLSALSKESCPSVARKICHAIAAAASVDGGQRQWPELLPAVFTILQSSEQRKRATAFSLIEAMAETSPDSLVGRAPPIMEACTSVLSDESHRVTGVAAFKATAAVLQILPSEQKRSPYDVLLPKMLQVLSSVLTAGDELEAQQMLEAFAQLADVSPLFFRRDMASFIEGMFRIGSASELDFCTRASAVEVLLSLAERAPAVMRQCSTLGSSLLPILLALACEVDEDEREWVAGPYDDDVDHDEQAAYGVEAMCRLMTALHARATMPTALQLVPQCLSGSDWRQRRVGLCVLGALADSASNAFEEHLSSVSEAAISLLTDPSPRVRFQALQLTGRLCDLYPANFQGVHHRRVVPAVCELVADASQPVRVRGHAASAMVNFTDTEDVPQEAVVPHLDAFLSALCSCLNGSAPPSVQCRALTAVASVAKTADSKFGKYYDAFIPGIKAIITAAAPKAGLDPENDLLLGQAMQCAGMIGEVVGRARFRTDGLSLMSVLTERLGSGGDHAQFVFEHVAPACGKLCRALGEDFCMFLPVVMPPVLTALEAEIKFSMETADPDDAVEDCVTDEQSGTQTAVLNIRGLGAQRVTLSTFAISSKQAAARLMYEYADALDGAFLEYVPAAISALLPAITFRFNEEVRSSAALTLAKVFTSALQVDVSVSTQLLSPCITVLLEGLRGETQDEPRTCMSSALRDLLCGCYESGGVDEETGAQLPPKLQAPLEAAAAISEELVNRVKASLARRVEKEAEFRDGAEWDDEDCNLLEEAIAPEEELMEHLVDALGYLLKGHGPSYLPVFDKVTAPVFGPLLATSQPVSLRWNAVCIFDDIVEHGGVGAHKYLSVCFPAFLEGTTEESSSMLQMASVYGVQQTAKHAPAFFLPKCSQALRQLVDLVKRPDAQDEDSLLVTENAVAAIGTLCVSPAFASVVDRSQLLPLWLSNLPLREDETEARVVHRLLCDLVEKQDPAVLGRDLQQVAAVVSVLAQILEMTLSDSEAAIVDASTAQRMGRLLNGMQMSMPSPVMERAWNGLTIGQQSAVRQTIRC